MDTKQNADDVLRDIRRHAQKQNMEMGARIMIEALKADRMIPDNIDKVKAASEAIRRRTAPMSPPMSIEGMRED